MTEESATPAKDAPNDPDAMDVDEPASATSATSAAPAPTPTQSTSRSRSKPKPTANPSGVSAGAASAAAAVGAAGAPLEPEPSASDSASGSGTGGTNADGSGGTGSGASGTPAVVKPKRGGSKPILKVSGIARVDNNLKPTLFSSTTQINQKNYYTDYLRRDDQIMYYREWNESQKRQKEETAKAKQQPEVFNVDSHKDDQQDLPAGSKTIVIHMGSQNIRVGLASHAYPKVYPNVIAHRRSTQHQQQQDEPGSLKDKRIPNFSPEYQAMLDAEHAYETGISSTKPPSEPDSFIMFGSDFKKAHATAYRDFRERMRFYKRRVVPNSHDLVVGFNQRARSKQELIPDHNDPGRIEWVAPDQERWPRSITGHRALTIVPGLSQPLSEDTNDSKYPYTYELKWPIRHGLFNETDYDSTQELLGDISLILVDALERELGITFKNYHEYNTIFIIPDLYVRSYVDNMVALLLQMGLNSVAIIQESMAATFGAGVSTACVVDIGAQTASVACVEEGMIIPDSRVNLKFGGEDVTVALTKLLLMSSFPFQELNLAKAYDFTLVEDLKYRYATTNDADITVQLYDFIRREPNKPAKKFQFKVFEEVMLAPLGFFYPEMFDQKHKQEEWCSKQRRILANKYETIPAHGSLFSPSLDIYDMTPNDPESAAQVAIAHARLTVNNMPVGTSAKPPSSTSANSTTRSTPVVPDAENSSSTPGNNNALSNDFTDEPNLPDDPLLYALTGLDHAIIESITQAALAKMQAAGQLPPGITLGTSSASGTGGGSGTGAQGSGATGTTSAVAGGGSGSGTGNGGGAVGGGSGTTSASASASTTSSNGTSHHNLPDPQVVMTNLGNAERAFYENLLVVGGAAAKLPGFNTLLTDRIGMWLSHAGKPIPGEISVMPAPREMDPQVLTWKGGGVFAKLKIVSECWVSAHDWDMLGNRALQYKTLFAY
ncbi:uncharacterized protein SAPINGB_P003111 [Magnusiomyces paraingens]|uniref:Uncharacterized protein n=1 Tax=Magnusiomyces paraingens TaxID=2606893 RepID=A0A5E8BRX3_9ASCO|nr:uncharacterized protein SAPINGB_P003111 [Saprochaete ingens]VVT51483.1 unnamed protein product [Saprochaete ingens]